MAKAKRKIFLAIALFLILIIELLPQNSLAKFKTKEIVNPLCTATGELACPKGYKPSCPKQYTPACLFLLNMQTPACLADTADNTFFNYHLDKISCKK